MAALTVFLVVPLPEGEHLHAYHNIGVGIEQFLFTSQIGCIGSTTHVHHHETIIISLTDQSTVPLSTSLYMDGGDYYQRIDVLVTGLEEDAVCI